MLCYIFAISFIILAHLFLYPFSNANPSVEDKMLIAFVRNDQKMQISEFTKQKYEAHLGIMYFMRNNWQCDKIANEFEKYERTECQKYRKILDILYEYLYREYLGIHNVKPKFVFKGEIEIEGPIIYAVNCLVKISQFYFMNWAAEECEYKLNKLFNYLGIFEPKLLNEKRLNYEPKFRINEQKLPINEVILQLAIDTANKWQINENLDGIIRQNFDKNLEKMSKKAEERAKKDVPRRAEQINDYKHMIIVETKFDVSQWNWTEDALFSEIVKGLATNSEKFFKMAKEYSNYLCRWKEIGNIYMYYSQMIFLGLNETEKMKKHLTQKYETQLGIIYLMRKNWHCDKGAAQLTEFGRKECKKNRKYVDILYEYLFRLYVEAKDPKVSKQLPPLVKPIFIKTGFLKTLIDVVQKLNYISKCFWKKGENEFKNINDIWEMDLVNEEELDEEIENIEKSKIKSKRQKAKHLNAPREIFVV